MNCPVSVWIDYYPDLSADASMARMVKAGFTHGEISLDHLEALLKQEDPVKAGKELRQSADTLGFRISQGHLSFDGGLCDDAAVERLKPELDLFAAAGIGKAVIHATGGKELPEAERYARRIRCVRQLAEYVESTGITLCIENMYHDSLCRTAQDIKTLIADAGTKNLAICLDTGHLHLAREKGLTQQTHREFILEAGPLLQALHIADNNGEKDTHQMPYSARFGINWHEVIQALEEINYQGLFNLEILGECVAPLPIRDAKLAFIRTMCEYMFSDAFLSDGYVYPPYKMR